MDITIVAGVIVALAVRAAIARSVIRRIDDRTPSWGAAIGAAVAYALVGGAISFGAELMQDGFVSTGLFVGFLTIAGAFAASTTINALVFRLTPGIAIGATLLMELYAVVAAIAIALGIGVATSFPWVAVLAPCVVALGWFLRHAYHQRTKAILDVP